MATSEYLAFLPLLFYGIALSDLLGQWKRLFDFKNLYLPYVLYTLVLSELGLYNVFIYLKVVKLLPDFNYIQYLMSLITPMLFMLMISIFTPDKNDNTKKYFNERKRTFYMLLGLFIGSHFLFDPQENIQTGIGRIFAMSLIFGLGFVKKEWSNYLPIIAWAIFFLFRIFVSH